MHVPYQVTYVTQARSWGHVFNPPPCLKVLCLSAIELMSYDDLHWIALTVHLQPLPMHPFRWPV